MTFVRLATSQEEFMSDNQDATTGDEQASSTPRGPETEPAAPTPDALRYAPPPAMPSYSPMVTAPPAPPPQPGGFKRGFGIGMGFGMAMLIISVVLSIISAVTLVAAAAAFGGAASANSAIDRTTTIWGSPRSAPENTIQAISITGPIQTAGSDGLAFETTTYGYEVAAILDALDTNDSAGVLLLINTPGGTITGSKAIADAVTRYQDRTGNKVFAYVEGMAASGGMMAMAGADQIISDYGTLIGSIGVVYGPFTEYSDVVGTTGTIVTQGVTTTGGITQEYLTAGEGKDLGNPFRKMTDEERAVLMGTINTEYNSFVSWVSSQRDIPADTIKSKIGAYVYGPSAAQKLGLIDQTMGREEAFAHVATSMGLDPDTASIVVATSPSWLDSLLGAEDRIFGQSSPLAPDTSQLATSVLCSGAPQVMVLYGELEFCG